MQDFVDLLSWLVSQISWLIDLLSKLLPNSR